MQSTQSVQIQMPAIRIFPSPVRRDASLLRLHRACVDQCGQAETYGSPVAAGIEMYNGVIIAGHNISMSAKSMHAEMLSALTLHQMGYRSTDFKRLGVLFQDMHHNISETFPACPACWPDLFDLTHPYLQIIVFDADCNIKPVPALEWSKEGLRYVLKESLYLANIPAITLSSVWPSNLSRMMLRKSNQRPKLPLARELREIRRLDPYYDQYCAKVARVDEPMELAYQNSDLAWL